jgi:hypothetical protein
VRQRGLRIHWAWVPAGILVVVTGGRRYGWPVTVLLVFAGLAVAAFAEWRARRRARHMADP